MANAPTRIKQAGEARTITFDFASKLNTGDSVASVVGNALTAAAGITAGAPTITGNKVTALISSGTADTTYRISCRVLTALGETVELDVDIRIVDGEN